MHLTTTNPVSGVWRQNTWDGVIPAILFTRLSRRNACIFAHAMRMRICAHFRACDANARICAHFRACDANARICANFRACDANARTCAHFPACAAMQCDANARMRCDANAHINGEHMRVRYCSGGWNHEPASIHPDPEESNVAMGDGVFGRNFVYVQDNAPPHTAHDTTAFLDQQDVEVIDWPARSPDMNPIEHVWDQTSVWIRDMDDPLSTVAELNNAVRQAWAAVRPGRVRTLVESMPRRVRALVAARGRHTCY